jgi:Domain of unknown function (DUF4124)
MKNRFLFACALLALSFSVSADIYKWVDSNGKVHYSNTPPPDVKGTKVKVDDPAPAPPDTASATAAHWKQKDEEFRQRQEEKYNAEKTKTDLATTEATEKHKKTCDFYKRDLEQVLSTRERVTRSADGSEIITDPNSTPLNNAQRARVIGDLNESIAKNCN